MKIKIIAVGKIKEKYLIDGIKEYSKRISRYCKLEIIEVSDEKAPENLSEKEEEIINETVEEIKRFIDFTLDLNTHFSFRNNFGVDSSSIDIAKEECYKDLKTFAIKTSTYDQEIKICHNSRHRKLQSCLL